MQKENTTSHEQNHDKRVYERVRDSQRIQLLNLLQQGHEMQEACILVGIKYNNAKAILRVYKQQGRKTLKNSR